MNNMILELGREVMPPGLAEDANDPLFRSSKFRPAPFLCETDSRILAPSMLAFAAREYHAAGVLTDGQSHLFLTLDGTPGSLRVARAMVRYAAGTNGEYSGVIGIWLEIEEEFDHRLWSQAMRFLCDISNSPSILVLFVSSINRPSVQKLMQHLCGHIPGLMRSVPWRYDYAQLADIICSYIRYMGVYICEPVRFAAKLKVKIAGRVTTSEQAVMLGDILARQATPDEEGRPFVSCDVIPYYGKGGEEYDVPFQ